MPLRRSEHTEYLPGVYELRVRRRDFCRALFAATEAFGVPLWDIPMDITDSAEKHAIRRSRRLVRQLLNRGWVRMLREGPNEPEVELSLEEALVVLDRPEPWKAPGAMFSIAATELGEGAYWTHAERRPHHRVGFNY